MWQNVLFYILQPDTIPNVFNTHFSANHINSISDSFSSSLSNSYIPTNPINSDRPAIPTTNNLNSNESSNSVLSWSCGRSLLWH